MARKYRQRQKVVVGQRVGRLTLLCLLVDGKDQRQRFWLCRCDCGVEAINREKNLAFAYIKSCGCLVREQSTKNGRVRATHGACTSPEYSTWTALKTRCNNPNDKEYHNYGGRGIKVCAQWENDFAQFLADVGPRPSLRHSLDRYPDKNRNYEPGNVRWATTTEQARNTRYNRFLTLNGVTRCLAEWEEITGFSKGTIRARIDRGWPAERLLEPRSLSRIRAATTRQGSSVRCG